MRKFFDNMGAWSRRNVWPFIGFVFLFAAAGVFTGRFVGGAIAQYAGSLQFVALVIYALFVVVLILFKPYGPSISRVINSTPVFMLRVLAFVVCAIIAFAFVVATLATIDSNVG